MLNKISQIQITIHDLFHIRKLKNNIDLNTVEGLIQETKRDEEKEQEKDK